jgi:hypothetical protein
VLVLLASKDQFVNDLKNNFTEFSLEEVLIGMPVSPLLGLQGDNRNRFTYLTKTQIDDMSKVAKSISSYPSGRFFIHV